MKKSEVLLKTTSLYLVYFLYTYFGSYIANMFPILDSQLVMLILDILFLLIIVLTYKKVLKKDFQILKKEYSLKKFLKVMVIGFFSIVLLNVVIAALGTLLFENASMDQNTQSIQNLASLSMLYTVFKTMVFGVVAEELLFRESLSDLLDNNVLFVLVSAVIYTIMNFIFTSEAFSMSQVLAYFLPALLFGTIYVKNKRNILLVMFTKFAYNLIPLVILISGV